MSMMNTYKKLSVIVPIYNTEKYLRQCLNSIINQTYTDLDIILVDDGSTDSSGIIADEYKSDSRVRVIHKNNQGLIKARLEGVKYARGEFVTFVDADDWIDINMYSDMMHQVTENNLDMILCGMNRFYESGKNHNAVPLLSEGLYSENDLREKVWSQMLWNDKIGANAVNASLCSKIVRKDILKQNLQNASDLTIYYGEDAAVLFPTMLEINSLYVSHNVYYYHRQREKGNIAPYIQDNECVEKLFCLYQFLKERFKMSGYIELFQNQLDLFFIKLLSLRKAFLESIEEKDEAIFPFSDINNGAKVIIYGAGSVGKAYIKQNEQYHFCNIVLWADKNYCSFDKKLEIVSPGEIIDTEFDFIIIAVQVATVAKEIRGELLSYGIPNDKIIWKATKQSSLSL